MKTLHFTFSTGLAFSGPVTGHQLALRCLPMQDAVQTVQSAALTLTPAAPQNRQTDGFGSPVVWTGIPEPHTGLTYQSSGTVQVDLSRGPLATPPNPVLSFPGALTRPGERLRTVYEGLRPAMSAAHPLPVLGGWIYETLQYVPGATGMRTTAEQALAGGAGVCQDFAHILVALARLAGWPARYCQGLTVGEGATHAWAEVYLDGRWQGWDPTRNCPVDERYLRFAVGRDAADCPVEQGVFYGACSQTQTVFMRVWEP